MARLRRLYAPGVPQLVQVRFARLLAGSHDATPEAALDQLKVWLAAEAQTHSVALHSWVILPDRIVLLATPDNTVGISKAIQGMGRRMAARMTHGRAFAERYRSALVEYDWVPRCMVWIETLPVALGIVDSANRWPWSSAQDHVGQRADDRLLTDHDAYWNLGNTPFARQAAFRSLIQGGMPPSQTLKIEQALFGQWALGNEAFAKTLSVRSSRRAAPAPRGRPRRADTTTIVTK